MFLDQYTVQEAADMLSQHIELVDKSAKNPYQRLDAETLAHLTQQAKHYFNFDPDFDLWFTEPPAITACGCMGPNPGCMFCPCAERGKMYYHRYEILHALKLESV